MTIRFYCPNCDSLIAFDSRHCGKRARCTTCGQLFIIPSKDDDVPQKVKPEPEKCEPVPGFYRAVFLDSWKIFNDPKNATSLTFVAAAVCFKFFLATACCMNYVCFVVVWGWLLGFYLNIIYETAFGENELPRIYLGTSITFLWYIIKPFFIFCFTMVVVQLPFFIALKLLRDKGLKYEDIWTLEFGPPLLLQALFILGLFFFPVAVLTTSVARDITLLRPDYLIAAAFKALMPYLVTVALLVGATFLEMQTSQYDLSPQISFVVTAGRLVLNLVVQIVAIIAMRSIGLFYRHYTCHFNW